MARHVLQDGVVDVPAAPGVRRGRDGGVLERPVGGRAAPRRCPRCRHRGRRPRPRRAVPAPPGGAAPRRRRSTRACTPPELVPARAAASSAAPVLTPGRRYGHDGRPAPLPPPPRDPAYDPGDRVGEHRRPRCAAPDPRTAASGRRPASEPATTGRPRSSSSNGTPSSRMRSAVRDPVRHAADRGRDRIGTDIDPQRVPTHPALPLAARHSASSRGRAQRNGAQQPVGASVTIRCRGAPYRGRHPGSPNAASARTPYPRPGGSRARARCPRVPPGP